MYPQRYTHPDAHCSVIHGAQDAGAADRPSMGEAERHLSGSESWEHTISLYVGWRPKPTTKTSQTQTTAWWSPEGRGRGQGEAGHGVADGVQKATRLGEHAVQYTDDELRIARSRPVGFH